jgi:SAM-dependent methyltransferase
MPDNTGGLSEAYLQKTQQGYVDFLMERDGVGGDYFELGPDVGLLSQVAAGNPNIGKMWLYEPNRSVAAALGERVKAKPFEIRAEMKDFSAVPDGSLGVCVLVHVLDHLPEVTAIMQALARKIRPGGYVLVVTHDERSVLARILRSRWPAFCLQHPLLFNPKSTKMFLGRCGLEVIETRRSTNYFPLTYLAKHLLYALGLEGIARWKWNAFVVPVRLGNIMTVARRKG